jgi:hypothetical protein
MRFWKENEAVDGSGQNVREQARSLVRALELTERQQTLLCHTFGNILPALACYAELADGELADKLGRQVERLQEIDAAIRAAHNER